MPAKRTSYAGRLATLSPGRIQTQSRTAACTLISAASVQRSEIVEQPRVTAEADCPTSGGDRATTVHERRLELRTRREVGHGEVLCVCKAVDREDETVSGRATCG